MKTTTVDQILTPAEIERTQDLYATLANTGKFAATIDAEIIAPNIERINKALGQENDSRFLAYAIEYALMQSRSIQNEEESQ